MRTRDFLVAVLGLTLFGSLAFADAPLKTALDLDIEQAKKVDEIQAEYRRTYAAKRGVYNTEMRKLRRARVANDSEGIATQEKITDKLKEELIAIKASEDAEIRKQLTPEQNKKFDAYIEKRNAMVGSNRDIR